MKDRHDYRQTAADIWLPGSLGNEREQRQRAGKQEGDQDGPTLYLPSQPQTSYTRPHILLAN